MSDHIGYALFRLGPPSEGDTIHRHDCRYVKAAQNPLPWVWAEGRSVSEWLRIPWLKPCGHCRPDLPREQEQR